MYEQERRNINMYKQAIKTYDEAKRHLDHKGFIRIYERMKWECKSIKTSHVYKEAKRRLNPKRVEGEIVYDHNTGNFVKYDQARDTYEEAKRHPDPKRAEGETASDHNAGKLKQRTDNSSDHPETDEELSDDESEHKKAKRRLNPKRAEGETVYDHNTG